MKGRLGPVLIIIVVLVTAELEALEYGLASILSPVCKPPDGES